MTIEGRIETFRRALEDASLTAAQIVQRYLIHPTPYVFENAEGSYFDLKNSLAVQFGVNPEDVKMVGSAKLGFSIAPKKLWKPFDDSSDIDMVIVSNRVFEEFWQDLYGFNINLTARSEDDERLYRRFLEYFFKGWLRPDVFPFDYPGKQRWFDFFKGISYGQFGYRKVAGAVFCNMHFFETYHTMNVRQLRSGGRQE